MMAHKSLDPEFVRSFFPALDGGPVFMENAGGSLVPRMVIERIAGYMAECQVQPATMPASPATPRRAWRWARRPSPRCSMPILATS